MHGPDIASDIANQCVNIQISAHIVSAVFCYYRRVNYSKLVLIVQIAVMLQCVLSRDVFL